MVFQGIWFKLAIVSLFFASFIDLSKKYILDNKMIKPNELVIYTTIIIGLFGLCNYFYDKKCRPISQMKGNLFLILIAIGLIGYIFTIAFTHSIDLSPDVTLVAMIVSLNIIFIYCISSVFFEKSPRFNIDVFFALVLIVIGINIIAKKF